MKLGGVEPTPTPVNNTTPSPEPTSDKQPPSDDKKNDKPFNDEPFDAGVEADEESDPKKFIEQLTGKLGQSLRKYNESQSQPDLELEKFAINSLLSATHTSEMDSEDQNDIIKKIKTAGKNDDSKDNSEDSSDNNNADNNSSDNNDNNSGGDLGGNDENNSKGVEEHIFEKKEDGFLFKPKKLSIFAPKGSEEAKFNIKSKLDETFNQDKKMQEPAPVKEPVVKPTPTKEPSIKPSRRDKPFLPTPSVQPDPKAMDEEDIKKKGYEVYHESFTKAINTAEQYAESKGYKVNEDDWFNQISTGPRKPEDGKTNRYSIPLTLKNKPTKKNLNIQVLNMGGNRYELNCYIA